MSAYDAKTLKAEVTSHVEKLATLSNEAARSNAMKQYLETYGRFHNYSPYNQFLIMFTRPDASHVAGFTTLSATVI